MTGIKRIVATVAVFAALGVVGCKPVKQPGPPPSPPPPATQAECWMLLGAFENAYDAYRARRFASDAIARGCQWKAQGDGS